MNCDLFTDRSIQHCKAPLARSPVFVNTEVHSAIWMPSSHVNLLVSVLADTSHVTVVFGPCQSTRTNNDCASMSQQCPALSALLL